MVGFLALFQPSNATLQNQDSDFFTPLYWEVQQTRLIQYYIQSIKRCLIADNGRHLRSCEILIDIKIMDISKPQAFQSFLGKPQSASSRRVLYFRNFLSVLSLLFPRRLWLEFVGENKTILFHFQFAPTLKQTEMVTQNCKKCKWSSRGGRPLANTHQEGLTVSLTVKYSFFTPSL